MLLVSWASLGILYFGVLLGILKSADVLLALVCTVFYILEPLLCNLLKIVDVYNSFKFATYLSLELNYVVYVFLPGVPSSTAKEGFDKSYKSYLLCFYGSDYCYNRGELPITSRLCEVKLA